ncbi:sugar transferase [Allocoleopsis sp.]|uniref:sugar transferase n=1 Tax=Allocoleopsis sp. TaxID=3088169 RepID=UPI002FCFB8F3
MGTSTIESSKLDLRAPFFTKLRQNAYGTWLRIVTLVLGDLFFLSLAWVMAGTYGTFLHSFWSIKINPASLFVVLPIEVGIIAAQKLYQSGQNRCDYWNLIKAISFSHLILLSIAFLYEPIKFVSRSTYLFSWLLSIFFICVSRWITDLLLQQLRKGGAFRYPTLIICPPEDAEKAIGLLERENCYKTIKYVDAYSLEKSNVRVFIEAIRYLGVGEVFVSSWKKIKDPMFLYWSLRNAGITLRILCMDVESFYRNSDISMIGGVPTINFYSPIITGFDFWMKRIFDFVFSISLLILLAPVLLIIAIIIKLDSYGSVFYKQERVGLHGKQFKAWKFRTMHTNADQFQKELEARNEMKDGVLFKMKDDPRITKVGKFLRRYSLDELPQLFNVLIGEMSLVGPRPLPVRDVQKFSEHHFIRHEVLPGITGLWQVSGRSNLTNFEDVLRLDAFYMENWTLGLDLQILLRTIVVILQKKGAY